MQISVNLENPGMDAEGLHDLSRQLCRTIQQETDVTASLPESPGSPGMKGDPVTAGTILMTFISSGAAVALFNVFKSYFDRHSGLEVSLKRADGETVSIKAQNLTHDQMDKTVSLIEEFMVEEQE